MRKIDLYFILIALAVMAFGCNDDDPDPGVEEVTVETATDIPADTAKTGKRTFFSLRTGEIISPADSNSTKWDIALQGTTIYVNGGTSGPGNVAAQIVNGLFSDITEASSSGYVTDDEGGSGLAIPTGSGNGWYTYSGPPAHKIEPIAGKILIIKTADGKYAKMEIISYYQGNPDLSKYTDSPPVEQDRMYTFNYAMQPDGSTNF